MLSGQKWHTSLAMIVELQEYSQQQNLVSGHHGHPVCSYIFCYLWKHRKHLSYCRCSITDSVPAGREPYFISYFENNVEAQLAQVLVSRLWEFLCIEWRNHRSTATWLPWQCHSIFSLTQGSPLSRSPNKAIRLHSRLGDALVVVVALVLVNLPERRVVLLALEHGEQTLKKKKNEKNGCWTPSLEMFAIINSLPGGCRCTAAPSVPSTRAPFASRTLCRICRPRPCTLSEKGPNLLFKTYFQYVNGSATLIFR